MHGVGFAVEIVNNVWEFGWEALVAIGTILLAIVTAAAVWAPISAEKRRAADSERLRTEQAKILAAALQDEVARIVMTAAEIRTRLRAKTDPYYVDWDTIAELIDKTSTAVLDAAFPHLFLLDIHTGRWVARTGTAVKNLKNFRDHQKGRENLIAQIAVDTFYPYILNLQRFSTPAYVNLVGIADQPKAMELPLSTKLTPQENAILVWMERGGPAGEVPPWPTDTAAAQ